MRHNTLFLLALLGFNLLTAKTLPVETREWVTSLREQALATPVEIDLAIRDQPLDVIAGLLMEPLREFNIIIKPQRDFPLISGRFSGHPLSTLERVLALYGFSLTERQGIFVVDKLPNAEKPFAETHWVSGVRFVAGDLSRPSLESILERGRILLGIPNAPDNQILFNGVQVGWMAENLLAAKRISYDEASNAFLFVGTAQNHQTFQNLLDAAVRPVAPLLITINGQTIAAHTFQKVQIGAQTHQQVTRAKTVWKLKASGKALVPAVSDVVGDTAVGNLITLWVEDLPNGLLRLHITHQTDTLFDGKLERIFQTQTLEIPNGETLRTQLGDAGETLQMEFKLNSPFKLDKYNALVDLEETRRAVAGFPGTTLKN